MIPTLLRHTPSPYPYLPPGYWYKGGAPRELLRRTLHPLGPKLPVRDFDIFRLEEVGDELDHSVAMQYLEDDYEFGRGVEVVEDMATYFKTRDLTVNEVALHHDRLRFTSTAQEHIESHTLCPTKYVCNALGEPLSQTYCKAVRFYSEGAEHDVPWKLKFAKLPKEARLFDLALNLDRCLLTSIPCAYRYIATLKEAGFYSDTPLDLPGLLWFINQAKLKLPMGISIFKNLPPEILKEI